MIKPKVVLLCTIIISLIASTALANSKLHLLKIMRGWNDVINVRVEIANTPEERMRGLMFRKSLPEDRGMWFIFDKDTSHPFWMKDTYISLDIMFVDNNMQIVSIQKNTKPLSTKPIVPAKPYRFVLEVGAGFVDKHKLKIGNKIRMQTMNHVAN